jgi:hypothetical protein|tara:strand:+ start:511 stop:813 length:303 start_codon:yes stop_codon:yes gene_type:complete
MKILLYSLLTLSILFTIGCEDEVAAVDCAVLATTYGTAAETFANGFLDGTATVEQCQASMDAMAALIDDGCEGFSLEDMDMTQAELDAAKDGSACAELFP